MIIHQFRKYSPINIVYLSVLGLMFCAVLLSRPPETSEIRLAEVNLLIPLGLDTIQISPTLHVLLTLGLTVIQALYLNKVMNKYYFTGRPNFLVALLYVTYASLLPSFLVLTPGLICNFMVIWMLDKLIGVHAHERAVVPLFDLGMIVTLGSLIYFPFLGNMLVLWAALLLFRPFQWREWVAPILGFITVYFLLWVLYFWQNQADQFWLVWHPYLNWTIPPISTDYKDYLIGIPVVLILILTLDSLRKHIFKRVVLIRKIIQLLLVLFLVSLLGIVVDPDRNTADLLALVPSVTIYSAFYFNYGQKRWFYESCYLILVLSIFLHQII
ncbi:MAG TPA: beta-carotene 15,15'-monooxygenase [Sphingobacteriaceae bacterium]|nr:beta-carotene 15,15'-monooxygenase [Sphingobacteriaceae bacterium]